MGTFLRFVSLFTISLLSNGCILAERRVEVEFANGTRSAIRTDLGGKEVRIEPDAAIRIATPGSTPEFIVVRNDQDVSRYTLAYPRIEDAEFRRRCSGRLLSPRCDLIMLRLNENGEIMAVPITGYIQGGKQPTGFPLTPRDE